MALERVSVAYLADDDSLEVVTESGVQAKIGAGGSSQPVGFLVMPQFRVGNDPTVVAFTPDGRVALVLNTNGNSVSFIDPASNETIRTVSLPDANPCGVAITPDGVTAYVTAQSSGTVIPITIADGTVGDPITVGTSPFGIAITPDGSTAYVGNQGDQTVTPIDLSGPTPGAPISVGNFPIGLAITPDGATLLVVETNDNTVTPIDIGTSTPGTPIPVGAGPFGIAITRDGVTAYVCNAGDNTVTPIAVGSQTPGTPIAVGTGPTVIAINPAGTMGIVSNTGTSGNVTVLDLTTNTVLTTLAVSATDNPYGVATSPSGETSYQCLSNGTLVPILLGGFYPVTVPVHGGD